MKIGKFAELNHVSKDTIRHYMDMEIILPEKKGGVYDFGDPCQKSLDEILYLKDMGFSLIEIKAIMTYGLLGKLTPYEQDEYYKMLFMEKHQHIQEEMDNLQEKKAKLEKKIEEMSHQSEYKETMGIDLSLLHLFHCVKCQESLILQEARVWQNQIIEGKLVCSCGECYTIEKGILMVGGPQRHLKQTYDQAYLSDYICETDSQYINNLFKSIDWAKKRMKFNELDNKVILELGSGIGFTLRNMLDNLPDSAVYIAVDHDIKRHEFLKNILESTGTKKKILFICADFLEIPIKNESVDVLFDASGTSNYSFNHQEFLIERINHYMKKEALFYGSFIVFKKFAVDSHIKENHRHNFDQEHIKSSIKSLGYEIVDEKVTDDIEKGGKYEDYFVDGEKVYFYIAFGKRLG